MYSADLRKHYMLDNPSWKRDIMPEIIEGKNVLDYVDPEIEAKLEALEMEEEALAAAAAIEVSLSLIWHNIHAFSPHVPLKVLTYHAPCRQVCSRFCVELS